jgi:hypothetical protein
MAEQKEKQWAKVPAEAIEDRRLSPTEFRVLVTLLSFADGSTGWTWRPMARLEIAERCGVSVQNISRATAALARYGWVVKLGNGGYSRPSKYRIVNPFTTRPESGQVNGDTRPESDTTTRPESGQVNGDTRPESDTTTRPESGRGRYQITSQIKPDATTKLAAPAPDPEPIAPEPVCFDGVRWTVDNSVYDRWIAAYTNGRTAQDTEDWIEQELAKASAWLQANPSKRKKNYLRFLTGWLTRASDSMRSRAYPQPRRPYH